MWSDFIINVILCLLLPFFDWTHLMLNKLLLNYQIIILDVNKRQRKPNVQSRMDNLETRATLGTRHRTKRNKTRTSPKTWGLAHVLANGKQFLFVIAYVVYINFRACYCQQYFSYIVAVSFIGGGNRGTRRKPPTCPKSLTSFIP
jgi:hypothetical protein